MRRLYTVIVFAFAAIFTLTSCEKVNDKLTDGLGTEESPYKISTAEQLRKLSADVNAGNFIDKYFLLTNDIDLGGKDNEFTAIGTADSRFMGVFDGGGHLVSGLYINQPELDNQGLFGFIGYATIKNLGVDGEVTARSQVGGVVGMVKYESIITNCYNSASIKGVNCVGGIAGCLSGLITDPEGVDVSEDAYVSFCHNTGRISIAAIEDNIDGWIGGIAGTSSHISIHDCYNEGAITDIKGFREEGTTGGIVGHHHHAGPLYNCYNTGVVYGSCATGGIVGRTFTPLYNCYNTGAISSDGFVGGIVGLGYSNNSNIDKCYNSGDITAFINENGDPWNTLGGIAGVLESEGDGSLSVKNCYNTGRLAYTGTANKDCRVESGGVVGYRSYVNESRFDISHCYNTGEIPEAISAYVKSSSIISDQTIDCYLSYCYYNSGDQSGDGTRVNVALKSDTEMKSPMLVELLNSNQNDAPWAVDSKNVNNHYPILSYQE